MSRRHLQLLMQRSGGMNDFAHSQAVLVYDANCGFCRCWVDWAKRHGAETSVAFIGCQDAAEIRAEAHISAEQCGRTAYLIHKDAGEIKQVQESAAAINGVLERLPGARNLFWRGLAALYHAPGLKQIEELGYRWVVRHRGKFAGNCRSTPSGAGPHRS